MNSKWIFAAAALALAASATPAHAVILLPGTTTPAVLSTGPAGAPLATLTSPFTGTDALSNFHYSGTLVSQVFQESSASNPLGGLTFVYDFTNNSISVDAIRRFTVTQFAGFTTDVSYDGTGSQGGTVPPLTVDRSLDGNVIGYEFGTAGVGGVAAGAGTVALVIRTDATNYTRVSAGFLNGAATNTVALGPTAMTPEPSTVVGALIALPMVGLAAWRRKRSNRV
jgi:hypothetical protein